MANGKEQLLDPTLAGVLANILEARWLHGGKKAARPLRGRRWGEIYYCYDTDEFCVWTGAVWSVH